MAVCRGKPSLGGVCVRGVQHAPSSVRHGDATCTPARGLKTRARSPAAFPTHPGAPRAPSARQVRRGGPRSSRDPRPRRPGSDAARGLLSHVRLEATPRRRVCVLNVWSKPLVATGWTWRRTPASASRRLVCAPTNAMATKNQPTTFTHLFIHEREEFFGIILFIYNQLVCFSKVWGTWGRREGVSRNRLSSDEQESARLESRCRL